MLCMRRFQAPFSIIPKICGQSHAMRRSTCHGLLAGKTSLSILWISFPNYPLSVAFLQARALQMHALVCGNQRRLTSSRQSDRTSSSACPFVRRKPHVSISKAHDSQCVTSIPSSTWVVLWVSTTPNSTALSKGSYNCFRQPIPPRPMMSSRLRVRARRTTPMRSFGQSNLS